MTGQLRFYKSSTADGMAQPEPPADVPMLGRAPDVRLIKHEFNQSGSFEVRYGDGRPSRRFYWDDNEGRRAITTYGDQVDSKQALAEARRFAPHAELEIDAA